MGPGFGYFEGKVNLMNKKLETSLTKFLSFGLFLVTVTIIAGPVSDPVNISKLFVLGTFSFGSAIIFLDEDFRRRLIESKFEILVFIAFIISSILATIFSSQPFQRSLYGISGRNFGLITLFSYLILFLATSQLRLEKSVKKLFYSFGAAGLANVLYGIVATYISDPIPWNNNYGALLGTFGNPNFAGAFYGLLSAYLTTIVLDQKIDKKIRMLVVFLIPLNFLCVLATHTTQGLLVFTFSNFIVIYFYLRLEIKKKFLSFSFGLFSMVTGALVISGILQYGPLQSFLYKRSVSLRGVYWDAAFKTGKEHLFTGVGLDGLGDWYRRVRSIKAATWLPGPEVVTNSAHNYFLDLFAFGGLPLLISYLALIFLGLVACHKIYKSIKMFEFLPVALIALYIGFIAQSIISLQQIGISIWGWIFPGLLISYARISTEPSNNFGNAKGNKRSRADLPWNIGIFVSACVGFILSIPPYSAEASLTSALKSQNYPNIAKALEPSYFKPRNSESLNSTIVLLVNNNLSAQALELAKKAVLFNPDSYDSWKLLYYIPVATAGDKENALINMKRLDPLNKSLEKLK